MNIRKPYYREFRRRFYETLGDKGDSILRYRGADNKEHYIASGNSPDVKPGGGMVETTWQELKDKRDAGKLIPGSLYRITDYQCTTTQENTRSAGHQFDIVLLALSENKLAEEGWAMMHENIYDVKFSDGRKKCYIAKDTYYSEEDEGEVRNIVDLETGLGVRAYVEYLEIDEENKKANYPFNIVCLSVEDLQHNYFQNSNLSAWKVWYCLDNDKSRFAWAQEAREDSVESIVFNTYVATPRTDIDFVKDGVRYFPWHSDSISVGEVYTLSLNPKVGDKVFKISGPINQPAYCVISEYAVISQVNGSSAQEAGRGVIYRLIDEYNNDIKYDFKNIQFKRTITNGQYDATNGTDTWCYTLNIWYNDMCQDASIVGNTLPNEEGYVVGVYDNNFGYTTAYELSVERVDTFAFALGNNVVLSFCDDEHYYGIFSNAIGNSFSSNTIGDYFNSNTIGNNFHNNKVGNNVYSNIIGNDFSNRTISDDTSDKNYGNSGVELATKDDIGNIETALSNI